jgi:hypothetical protein
LIPGRTLHRLAARVCSAKTVERVVEPAIADFQREFSATSSRHALHRGWILLNGYFAMVKVMMICGLKVSIAAGDERAAIMRTLVWSFMLMVAVTALLLLPPLSIAPNGIPSPMNLVLLIPQAVPLAIPIGLTFGIAVGLAGRARTRATIKAAVLVAIAASVLSFATLVWIMPAANQAYREEWARSEGYSGPLTKGPTEMTLSELNHQMTIEGTAGSTKRAQEYEWAFHLRFALSTASVVLAIFVSVISAKRAVLRVALALMACLLYWALIFMGQAVAVYSPVVPRFAGIVSPFIGAWLPNVVLILIALIVASSRSSSLRGPISLAK